MVRHSDPNANAFLAASTALSTSIFLELMHPWCAILIQMRMPFWLLQLLCQHQH